MTEPATPMPPPIREVPVLDPDDVDDSDDLADLDEFLNPDLFN